MRGEEGEKRGERGGVFIKTLLHTVLWVRAITNMHRMVRGATLINEHCGIAHTWRNTCQVSIAALTPHCRSAECHKKKNKMTMNKTRKIKGKILTRLAGGKL